MTKILVKAIVPHFLLNAYYYAMEFFAAARYGFPGKKLKVIGVTGTKGKSTTVYLLTRILEEAGLNVASSSSIEFRMHKKSRTNELKMALPGRATLQSFLSEAIEAKCDYVVLETSSEGLAQYRAHFIRFVGAIFTNIAPEHIESHGSFENYRKAKAILFELVKKGFVTLNEDDPNVAFFSDRARYAKRIFFGKRNLPLLKNINLKLLGEFNEYNALAAYAVAKELGIRDEVVGRALERVSQIPGRLEEIKKRQPFRVFVDYAHNPSSLEAVLKTCYKLKANDSKLLILTGAQGGGRDKWKRSEMGKIAARYADVVVITNEDPYMEDPAVIVDDVYQGTKRRNGKATVLRILDRGKAIRKILQLAKKDDIVIVAGKGSETVMETATGKIQWSDKEKVLQMLAKIFKNHAA